MILNYPTCKFLIKLLTILQLLSCDVEAFWANNKTLIKLINSMNTSWRAAENPTHVPYHLRQRRGKMSALPVLKSVNVATPVSFDSRVHWKHCRMIINRIRIQGECVSCWAVATASMLSDRICIETKGAQRVHLSAEDLITCCDFCKAPKDGSCDGGVHEDALHFWTRRGIVTGGEPGSLNGCKPYSWTSLKGKNQPCVTRCTNKHHWKNYAQDKHKGKLAYRVPPNEEAIKREIFVHGPVAAAIDVHECFHQYKEGIYQIITKKRAEILHAVKIIGWGEEFSTKYWLVANTWGAKYGMNGYVKFLRGVNHSGIESYVIAGRTSGSLQGSKWLREVRPAGRNKGNVIFLRRVSYQHFVFGDLQTITRNSIFHVYLIITCCFLGSFVH